MKWLRGETTCEKLGTLYDNIKVVLIDNDVNCPLWFRIWYNGRFMWMW